MSKALKRKSLHHLFVCYTESADDVSLLLLLYQQINTVLSIFSYPSGGPVLVTFLLYGNDIIVKLSHSTVVQCICAMGVIFYQIPEEVCVHGYRAQLCRCTHCQQYFCTLHVLCFYQIGLHYGAFHRFRPCCKCKDVLCIYTTSHRICGLM